jgi:uncharacterized protein
LQYRQFGRLDWQGSALGFGAMRLGPLGQWHDGNIDEAAAVKMIRYAIDHGVNYIDTAFNYGMGASERVVGKALQDGYRQKVRIATKLFRPLLKSPDDFEPYLNVQLKRLQTDKIDFYLLHSLNAQFWQQLKEWKVLEFIEKKMAEGKIGCFGFSFHDEYPVFKEIVDYYDNWTFCQVQYNYLDENFQAGRKGVEYAAGKGLAVVVMEPLRGGQLTKTPPPSVAGVWNTAPQRSHIEWALDWIWNQPEISVVLSGMSTLEQVVQNVTFAARSVPGMLSAGDLALFSSVKEAYRILAPTPCTGCAYCQPCPNGVNIPKIFEIYNDATAYENPMAALNYAGDIGLPPAQRADRCLECGECVEKCPQKIDIPAHLKKAHNGLTKGGPLPPPPPMHVSFDE